MNQPVNASLEVVRDGQRFALNDLADLMPGDKLINNTASDVVIQLPSVQGSPTLKVGPGGAVSFSDNPESLGGDPGELMVSSWDGPVELAEEAGAASSAGGSWFADLSGAGMLTAAGGAVLLAASAAGGGGGSDGTDSASTTTTTTTTSTAGGPAFVTTQPEGSPVVEPSPTATPEPSPEPSDAPAEGPLGGLPLPGADDAPAELGLIESIVNAAQTDGQAMQDQGPDFKPEESATASLLQSTLSPDAAGADTNSPNPEVLIADLQAGATSLTGAVEKDVGELLSEQGSGSGGPDLGPEILDDTTASISAIAGKLPIDPSTDPTSGLG